MLKAKRSQAALEFLMTYGWAILVVLIVISALAYFGVLNPQRLLPSKCSMTAGFGCQNHIVNQGVGGASTVTLALSNGMGSAIQISSLELTGQTTAIPDCVVVPADIASPMSNGEVRDIGFTCDLSSLSVGDTKYRWEITLGYYTVDSGVAYTKTVQGELFTTVEP